VLVTASSVEGGDLDNVPTSSSWPVHASSHVSPHYNSHPMYFQTSAASLATAALTAAAASATTANSSAATPYTPRNNAAAAAGGSTSISDAQLAAVAGYMPASATAAATAAAARKKLEEDGAWKLKEWPPARGYTLSCWVYVHHYGDAVSTGAGSRRRSSAGMSAQQQQQQQQGGCMPLTLLEMQGEGHSASSPLSITRIEIVPLTGGSAGDGGVLRVSVHTLQLPPYMHIRRSVMN
jgi:hypothetical protein